MRSNKYLTKKEIILSLKQRGLISDNCTIRKTKDGLIHEVYKITSNGKILFLKIRLDHFYSNKSITINPKDILFESKALTIVDKKLNGMVPKIIDRGSNYLLLKGLSGRGIYRILREQSLSEKQCVKIATDLSHFHKKMALYKRTIRPIKKEEEQYNSYLYWRFGIWNNPRLNGLVDDLKSNHPKQIIYGDLNPHNMVLGKNGLCFFDLETVHRGNRIFDVGFFLGHLAFSYLNKIQEFYRLLSIFKESYSIEKSDEEIISLLIIGTIFYRLKSEYKYETAYRYNKDSLIRSISKLLQHNIKSFEQLVKSFQELHSDCFPKLARDNSSIPSIKS
jgi:5-methylthioribose kinase